ncbi:Wadjet anti-phage system protein JetD domain-containing protein [Aeromonas cavernicola]|uniref:Wadjet protein JetD C-terminal domain-containing protein n=1 Tax=Aeromonas cavernicola TaxID=1006623 RepID=A0A2H9U9U2_9GAMM|nr:Wadjet anti-phage system protein JetD domain-containing protein [Aeromonas cavernicola]PJG60793.1 hypothetical protein CUC53_00160 [Aeromonas cavernicola]
MGSLFDDQRIQRLCTRLLDEQSSNGVLLESAYSRELLVLLQAVDGVRPVGRSARYRLTPEGTTYITQQLALVVPAQANKQAQLQALGVTLPAELNQATFNALWYGDSKRGQKEDKPGSCEIALTQDEVIRLRTLHPLRLVDEQGDVHDMTLGQRLLGEVMLPERAMNRLRAIDWQGSWVITVENKGAFIDYPLQAEQLLLYTPGRNTSLAKRVIPLLPAGVRWAHFGDLGQRGIDIALELAASLALPPYLWLPKQVARYVAPYGMPVVTQGEEGRGKIGWRQESGKTPVWLDVLNVLAGSGRWLEQESLVLAPDWQPWLLAE